MQRTFEAPAPNGYKGTITATLKISRADTRFPCFSLTGEIGTAHQQAKGDPEVCGCIHDEIVSVWPDLAFAVSMHLSDSNTGAPMHALSNGTYNIAGLLPNGGGERWHRGNELTTRTPAQILRFVAEHYRCSAGEAEWLVAVARERGPRRASAIMCRLCRERWAKEAAVLRTFIESTGSFP